MTDRAVTRETRDGLVVLRMCRPESRNAFTDELKASLAGFINEFFDDESARCLLITGTGNVFAAGGDLHSLRGEQTAETTRRRFAQNHRWVRRLLTGEKPVIMAINGAAAGAGFALALLGDIVLAADDAFFIAGFPRIGVAADLALTLTLPRAVGTIRAKEILFSNRRVESEEALEIGLISGRVAGKDLMDAALQLGESLATGPTLSFGLTKRLVHSACELPLEALLAEEVSAQVQAFASYDRREGVEAFLAKRSPRFRGC